MDEILASIRRIISDDGEVPKATTAESAPLVDVQDGIDALFDAVEEPPPPRAASPRLPLPEPEPEVDFAAVLDEPPPAPARPQPASAPIRSDPPLVADEDLISRETKASIGNAFNMLSHTVFNQNARTLEDLVKEMLTPMLKVWLDDNLPPLVERLVRAEIERVARGVR